VPGLYSILRTDWLRVVGQVVLSVAGWVTLAWVVSRRLSSGVVRVGLLASVLLVGLAPVVTEWNRLILSESLAISLTMLFGAAWVVFLRQPSRWAAGAVMAIGFLWAFSRNAQVPVVLVIGVAALASSRWFSARRLMMTVGAALVAVGLLGSTIAASAAQHITRYNSATILADRVLVHPDQRQWYVAHGMPLAPDEEVATGSAGYAKLLKDPHMVHWIDTGWKTAYLRYLVTHPVKAISQPAGQAPRILSDQLLYAPPRHVAADPIGKRLFGEGGLEAMVMAGLVLGLAALTIKSGRLGAERIVAVGAVLIAAVWYLIVWMLSATELPRLAVPASVTLRVALLVLALTSMDCLWVHYVKRRRPAPFVSR
jgi:hypothetical protein